MHTVRIVLGGGVRTLHASQTLLLHAGQTAALCLRMLYWRSKGGVCHGLTGKNCTQKQRELCTLRQRCVKLCHSMQLMPGCSIRLVEP